jgi:IS30 family transposase
MIRRPNGLSLTCGGHIRSDHENTVAALNQGLSDAITRRLNTRPRKRLGYRTPEKAFYEI